jgi:hypothetical protein
MRLNEFPKQKVASGSKSITWAKQCAEAAIRMTNIEDEKIRPRYRNKVINYNLANDILDQNDIQRICNPFKIKGVSFPAKMQNYPVALPKIDLLVGEEVKRQFDWKFLLVNTEAIREKDKNRREELTKFITAQIKREEASSEDQLKAELKEKVDHLNYSFQDLREKRANMIMKYYWDKQNFKKKFNEGFYDVLIAGEENYCVELQGTEPILRKVNPLNLRAYRSGESPWLQDSDIIVEEGYYSPGQVIDAYYDYLSPSDIDKIEIGNFNPNEGSAFKIRDNELKILPDGVISPAGEGMFDMGEGMYVDPSLEGGTNSFRSSFDTNGNILVTKIVWKSYRKLGFLTKYDMETGEEIKELVDEKYTVREDLGEEVKWKWLGEWWETTKLGGGTDAIYTKIQRRPSFRNPGNPSKCSSGYVGLAYNINSSKAMSLLDRMKPLQYLYNVLMYRTELAFAKSHGKIMRLPLHEIPDGWTMDKYLAFAFGYNIAVYDAFKEGSKGASQGKLAGHMQQNKHEIDLEMGSYIQQHIDMMGYIKEEIGEISGVSKARQGQIHHREAVGNTEREVTQSSHITEKWFMAHDLVKKEVMQQFLDVAIYALDKNSIQSQIVVGDFMTETFEASKDDFSQAELGIVVSDSGKDFELMGTLKSLAGQLVQSEQIGMGELAAIYNTNSIADMTRKIENAQQRKNEREERMASQQTEAAQQMNEETIAWEKEQHYSELNQKKYEVDTKLLIEEMKLEQSGEGQDDGSGDRIIKLETLRQNARKIEDAFYKTSKDLNIKDSQLAETKRSNLANEKLKAKQIAKAAQKKPV